MLARSDLKIDTPDLSDKVDYQNTATKLFAAINK